MEHFICYPKNLENFTNKTRILVKNKITSTNSINDKQYQFDTCSTMFPIPTKIDTYYYCMDSLRSSSNANCGAFGSGSKEGGKSTAQAWEKACGDDDYCKSRCPLAVALAAKTSRFCDKAMGNLGPEGPGGLYGSSARLWITVYLNLVG